MNTLLKIIFMLAVLFFGFITVLAGMSGDSALVPVALMSALVTAVFGYGVYRLG